VPHALFDQLASGKLSAVVMPQDCLTFEERGLEIKNQSGSGKLVLQVAASVAAGSEPGLCENFKIITLSKPAVYQGELKNGGKMSALQAALPVDVPASKVFDAAALDKKGYVMLPEEQAKAGGFYLRHAYGNNGVMYEAVDMAVATSSDMNGIAAGYALMTLPQRQPIAQRARLGW